MNRSTPGLPVHHQLLEFTQTHAHRVGDAIQPSHPLSPPSPPAPIGYYKLSDKTYLRKIHNVSSPFTQVDLSEIATLETGEIGRCK